MFLAESRKTICRLGAIVTVVIIITVPFTGYTMTVSTSEVGSHVFLAESRKTIM